MNETTAPAYEPITTPEAFAAYTAVTKSAASLRNATDQALRIDDANMQCAMHLQIARGWKELAEVVGAAPNRYAPTA